jgi:hypothetical protein
MSLYDYAADRPTFNVDPSGLAARCKITGIHFIDAIRIFRFPLPALFPGLPGASVVGDYEPINGNTTPWTGGFSKLDLTHTVWVVWTGENLRRCLFELFYNWKETRTLKFPPKMTKDTGSLGEGAPVSTKGNPVLHVERFRLFNSDTLAISVHTVVVKEITPDTSVSFLGTYSQTARDLVRNPSVYGVLRTMWVLMLPATRS